jgi:hypothetical protein
LKENSNDSRKNIGDFMEISWDLRDNNNVSKEKTCDFMGFKQEKWSLHRIYARTRGVFMALKWLRLWEWCQFNVMMILDILDDVQIIFSKITFFPTCQVRVVRFYVSCLLLLSSPLLSSSSCSTAIHAHQDHQNTFF